ncbi:unnamed protein product [Nezara viridula]|uniref:Gustatory receptor n=1 Tax=Nezara viridula TaxID=85310 RepID=A0A9P0EGL3_NEZVI|nr:unnamed protein product [Nezara viridula]
MTVLWRMSHQFASVRKEVCRIVCIHLFQRKVPSIVKMADREYDRHQLCSDNKLEGLFYHSEGNMIQCIRTIKLLNRCLFNIRAVDLVLFSIGEKRPNTKMHISIIFIIALIVTTYILRLQLHPPLLETFNITFMYGIHSLMVLTYLFIDKMAYILLHSFKSLRQSLLKCSGLDGKESALLIEKLIYCHHQLCNSSRDFNEFSSLQILIIVALEFITSFGEVYVVICILFNNSLVGYKNILIAVKSLWSVIAMTLLWQLTHQFASVRNEILAIVALEFMTSFGEVYAVICIYCNDQFVDNRNMVVAVKLLCGTKRCLHGIRNVCSVPKNYRHVCIDLFPRETPCIEEVVHHEPLKHQQLPLRQLPDGKL